MPPLHKLLKNDGPACRVCGCTWHNACPTIEIVTIAGGVAEVSGACSWVRVDDEPGNLCSACAGTDADLAEVIGRMISIPARYGVARDTFATIRGIGRAALDRFKKAQH